MDEEELLESLRVLLHKEQELYKQYLLLDDATDDLELKEVFGHNAFEAFIRLKAIMDIYKDMIDERNK